MRAIVSLAGAIVFWAGMQAIYAAVQHIDARASVSQR